MARASGSYPEGRRFKSHCRYHNGPVVKRSRHRPFTAVTRVRFPVESPEKERAAEETAALHIWKVCGSGSGVEHRLAKARVASSNLVFRSNSFFGEKEKLCAIGGIGRRT